MTAEAGMGTGELVAQGREARAAQLKATAAEMHAITLRLTHDPKAREENEAHAKRLEDMAYEIDKNAVLDHARGRQ